MRMKTTLFALALALSASPPANAEDKPAAPPRVNLYEKAVVVGPSVLCNTAEEIGTWAKMNNEGDSVAAKQALLACEEAPAGMTIPVVFEDWSRNGSMCVRLVGEPKCRWTLRSTVAKPTTEAPRP